MTVATPRSTSAPPAHCRGCQTPRTTGRWCNACFSRRIPRSLLVRADIKAAWPTLPGRLANALGRECDSADEVCVLSDRDFLALRNCGVRSLATFRSVVPTPQPICNWVGEGTPR